MARLPGAVNATLWSTMGAMNGRRPATLAAAILLAIGACSAEPEPGSLAGSRPTTSARAGAATAAADAASSTSTPPAPAAAEEGRGVRLPPGDDTTVTRVVDGDTFVVAGGERVRLIGIDTPETVHPRRPVECFGREASRFLTGLIPPGTPVRLVYDVERLDRYSRTLAYVYRLSDGLFVNAEMVRRGYAQIYTVPPNVAHVEELLAVQREARQAARGLWSACR